MAYEPTIWKDRAVEKPKTYTIQDNGDGTVTLIPMPGIVTEEGTPVNANNLNKLEQGLKSHEADYAAHWNKIDEVILSADAVQVDLNMPSDYDEFRIICSNLKGTHASLNGALILKINQNGVVKGYKSTSAGGNSAITQFKMDDVLASPSYTKNSRVNLLVFNSKDNLGTFVDCVTSIGALQTFNKYYALSNSYEKISTITLLSEPSYIPIVAGATFEIWGRKYE
ncbi:hypothetical protein [Paratissierella segnis]|uniref:Uncharacterized protein n=1 Tax=Paratissierella segnis TaxID=2763679 RepID=A0A926IKX2_9FIRM|nr:hypothetical protein [Paratissierella segnis]MBC8588103.1 hypothetical protein [Paratissierella segnis]